MKKSESTFEAIGAYPKEFILNDGTGVTIRPLDDGDRDALAAMFKRFSEEDLWFLNHDLSDPALIGRWLRHLDPKRIISLVAILEGRIIANAAMMMKRYGARSHIGKIRIAVDPLFRGKRLATWLLLDLVNLGMSLGLGRLVMRLVSDRDDSIIKAVQKLGFTEEANLEDYVLDSDGNPHDLVIMTKTLPQV